MHYTVKKVRRLSARNAADARIIALDLFPLTEGTDQFQIVQVLEEGDYSDLQMDRDTWKPF